MKKISDVCSNCGCDIDFGYECPRCGALLCNDCICLCEVEVNSSIIDTEFEIKENGLITNLETSIQEVKKKKIETILSDGEDEWIEIRDIPTVKKDKEDGEV